MTQRYPEKLNGYQYKPVVCFVCKKLNQSYFCKDCKAAQVKARKQRLGIKMKRGLSEKRKNEIRRKLQYINADIDQLRKVEYDTYSAYDHRKTLEIKRNLLLEQLK
jgi:hypothetical protein